jgi:hypothetical protein
MIPISAGTSDGGLDGWDSDESDAEVISMMLL